MTLKVVLIYCFVIVRINKVLNSQEKVILYENEGLDHYVPERCIQGSVAWYNLEDPLPQEYMLGIYS